jgi:carbon-monoxide dehydrogenase large subunit
MRVGHVPPARTNRLGAKGGGESGTVGSTLTVTNVIMDALWPLGVRKIEMPATLQRVWQAIQDARK